MTPIRVVLVDDQELVRSGLRLVLQPFSEVEIVGEATEGWEAVELVGQLEPDVVLMDVRMPVMDGVAATREICRNGIQSRVLILTTFDLDEYAFEALRVGASGFMVKDTPVEDLVAAIKCVQQGDSVVAPSTTRRLVEHYVQNDQQAVSGRFDAGGMELLTPREGQILRLLALGMSNDEVATACGTSVVTTKAHVRQILAKLGLRDRTQAVIYAYETGVVRVGERPDPTTA